MDRPTKSAARKPTTVMVPLVGKVTAGEPITAVENIDEYVPLPKKMVGSGKHFILSVQGDSMINAGIFDKDYVIVRQQPTADNGDIVVAMTPDRGHRERFTRKRIMSAFNRKMTSWAHSASPGDHPRRSRRAHPPHP